MSISHPLAGTAIAAGDSRLALRCAVEALADQCEISGLAVDQCADEQELRAQLESFDWSATREDLGDLAPLLMEADDQDQDFTDQCVEEVVKRIAAYAARDTDFLVSLRPQLAFDLLLMSRALDAPARLFDDQGNAGDVMFWPEGSALCLIDWGLSGGSLEWSDLDQLLTPDQHAAGQCSRRADFLAQVVKTDDGRRYSVYGPVRGHLANNVTRGQAIVGLLLDQEGCTAQGGYSDAHIVFDGPTNEQLIEELDTELEAVRQAYEAVE